MVNAILNFLDKHGFRGTLAAVIFLGYLKKGKNIRSVKYVKEIKAWVLDVKGNFFVSRGPGWAYDFDYLTDVYEQYSGFAYRPGRGDVVIDVGAGLGEESFLFSRWVGDAGKVFSIEANPATYLALRRLVTLNNLRNTKTELLAISDHNGTIFIEDDDDLFLQNTIATSKDEAKKMTEVSCCTLDEFFIKNSISRVDFLRVNIEGAEQLLTQGMSACIGKIKHVSISCHDFREGLEFYKTREKVLQFLKANNFSVTFQKTGDAVRDNYLYGTRTVINGIEKE